MGVFPLTASAGRFIIWRLRVGHRQRRGSFSMGGGQQVGVCFTVVAKKATLFAGFLARDKSPYVQKSCPRSNLILRV